MKYTNEIKINAPIEKVAALLGDHEQMKIWLKEVEGYKLLSGKPRHVGAKTRLKIRGGAGMEVVETILAVDFPYRFITCYEMQGASLVACSMLQAAGKNSTRFSLDQEFKFTGMLKLITALMKPAFIMHSQRIMKDFKQLAEKPS